MINPTPYEDHPHGWGTEKWIVNNEEYCGKLLCFEPLKRCSIHYHKLKRETFTLVEGAALISIGTSRDTRETEIMVPGASYEVPRGVLHQIIAGSDGCVILEISTHHEDSDSYRVEKGD